MIKLKQLLTLKYLPKVGDFIKVDFEMVKKYESNPNYLKIVRKMLKNGGGKVYVSGVDRDRIYVRTSANDFLGDATIPLAAVKGKG